MDQRTLAGKGPSAGRAGTRSPGRRLAFLAALLAGAIVLLSGCAADTGGSRTERGTSGGWITVQRGDTLGELARQAGVPLKRLQRFNPGVRARHLAVGQRLLMPDRQERAPGGGPYRYRIRPGDTYSGIARHFSTRSGRIQAANPGVAANSLRVGQLIQVPLSGGSSAPRAVATGKSTTPPAASPAPLHRSAGGWPWPLDDYRIVRRYGKDDRGRLQPMLLAGASGATARAVADGEVSFADTMRNLGRVVIVHHDNNLQSVYALCSRVNVNSGETIKRGDTLCRVSRNPDSGEFILLFDMRRAGKPINPSRLLK